MPDNEQINKSNKSNKFSALSDQLLEVIAVPVVGEIKDCKVTFFDEPKGYVWTTKDMSTSE